MEIMISKPNGHTRIVNIRQYMSSEDELRRYVEKTFRGYTFHGVYEGLPFGRVDSRNSFRYSNYKK